MLQCSPNGRLLQKHVKCTQVAGGHVVLVERNILLTQICYNDAEKTSNEKEQLNREFYLYAFSYFEVNLQKSEITKVFQRACANNARNVICNWLNWNLYSCLTAITTSITAVINLSIKGFVFLLWCTLLQKQVHFCTNNDV